MIYYDHLKKEPIKYFDIIDYCYTCKKKRIFNMESEIEKTWFINLKFV